MANSRIVFRSGSITITPLAATLTFTTAPPKVISINVQDPVSVGDSSIADVSKPITIPRPPKSYEKELLLLLGFLSWLATDEEKEALRETLRKLIDWLSAGGGD